MPNLCKFPISYLQDSLSITNYVRETNIETMKEKNHLKLNRMLLIVQGEGIFEFDGDTVPFRSGNLIFGFINEAFYLVKGTDVEYMYMDFQGARADELFRRFSINKFNRSFSGFDGLIPLWDDSLSRASEKTLDLASESILLYTFSRMFADTSERSSIVREVVRLTEENFTDPTLSISSIADSLTYNSKYLSHIFKEQMHVPYSKYLQSIRLKYAIALLDRGLDSIKNVAFLSGFSDPLYFSNVFKKQIGVSPKEYIKGREIDNGN